MMASVPSKPGETESGSQQAAPARYALLPAVVLFFLAPLLAELLSGSSPPREYFNPLAFTGLHLVYGALAVLLREWAIRRSLGWWGRMVLALVVGIYVEGLVCKSLFSPAWADFSFPPGWGRAWGVNWPWTLNLLLYHGAQSLLLPWLIVDLLFPRQAQQPALSPRLQLATAGAVLALGVLGWSLMPMRPGGAVYWPGPLAAVLCWSALLAIPLLAARVREPAPCLRTPVHPYFVGWVCGLGWFGFLVLQLQFGERAVHPLLACGASLAYLALALGVAYRWRGRLHRAQHFAIVAGCGWFWAIFAVIQQLDNSQRSDDTSGMAVLGGLTLLALIVLRQHLLRRENSMSQ